MDNDKDIKAAGSQSNTKNAFDDRKAWNKVEPKPLRKSKGSKATKKPCLRYEPRRYQSQKTTGMKKNNEL
jgi:hypothetical protein